MADPVPERPVASGLAGQGGAGAAISTLETTEVSTVSTAALGMEDAHLSPGQMAFRRFLRHKLAMASLALLLLLGLACAFAPLLASHGYADILGPKFLLDSPRRSLPFGTDAIGRDMFARVLYGGRVSLAVGAGVAILATAIGTFIGAITGYFGGRLDNLLMRITDLFLAMPLLVILILASRALHGKIYEIVLLLGLFVWMPLARIVRGLFLSLKEKEFVEAARAMGAGPFRIMFRHMLPNCWGPIIVNATLTVAQAILTESVLSFLGFGIQPPVPTWGNLLNTGRTYTIVAPWLVYFPGVAIFLTVVAVNFLGDGLRDAFDPSQRRVRT